MGLQYAWTGEVACRRRQPREASSGEVDDIGLLLGQAAPLGSAEDWLCQRLCVPRSTTSLATSLLCLSSVLISVSL